MKWEDIQVSGEIEQSRGKFIYEKSHHIIDEIKNIGTKRLGGQADKNSFFSK